MTVRLPRRTATVVAPSLLVASIVMLCVGRFIQFDDTSGFGDIKWVWPFAPLAFVTAIAGLAVACQESTARRVYGGALLLLAIAMFVVARTDDGFRFIWTTYEGELTLFTIVLGMIALFLLTPSYSATAVAHSGYLRGLTYLAASMVFVFVAFWAGVMRFERTQCSAPDFDGECDVAVIDGFVWAAAALVVAVAAIVAIEVLRRRRTSAQR